MAGWCLTRQAEQKLLEALQKDGNPQKMVDRGSEGRLAWFTEQVGAENAKNLNALFESKMLLKSQVKGFQSFVKSMGGSKQIKNDFLSKVERLDKALSQAEVKQFLGDYISKRLGIETITEEQFKVISDMSTKLSEYKNKLNPDTINNVKTTVVDSNFLKSWNKEGQANQYGSLQRAFENYVESLKNGESISQMLKGRGTQFKNEFVKNPIRATASLILDAAHTISENSLTVVANWDDSLFGRQAIPVLLTGHPVLWTRNFIKSGVDIIKALGGKETTDALLADVYANPLYLNGEFKTAGLLELFEEQRPTFTPERIPVIGRVFKTADQAFINGSLRTRTELYTMMRNAKVETGIEMIKEEIKSTGKIVNSVLARGDLGKVGQNPIIRLLMWAPKMLKADLDILTAHIFDKDVRFLGKDSRTAIGNLIKIVGITAIITTLLNTKKQGTVEVDPRSSDFLKPYGKFGYLRGMPQLITFMAREITGQTKNNKGEIINYAPGIGKMSRLDALISFLRGKAPPATGGVYDWLAGQDYKGNPPTFTSTLIGKGLPISLQNLLQLRKDPSLDNVMGIIADFFGFNANITPDINYQSNLIPTGKPQKSTDIVEVLKTYAEAMGTDPETAFNRFFSGQKILRVTNGAIIVERMSVGDSQAIKEKYGKDTIQVKLDHTIPLELGGGNDTNNLKLVTTAEWSSYTKVENALGSALKKSKISKNEAQKQIKYFKSITNTKDRKEYGDSLILKYK